MANIEQFLAECYKAGQEWAEDDFAAKKSPRLEDGVERSYWDTPSADDYYLVKCVGIDFDIDTGKEYKLRTQGLERLYRGCTERWAELFGKQMKRYTKEQVVEAAKTHVQEPVKHSEPHKVNKAQSMAETASTSPDKLTSFGPRKIFGKGAIKYIFPDNTSLVKRNGQADFISSCKNMMCFCDLSSPCQKNRTGPKKL